MKAHIICQKKIALDIIMLFECFYRVRWVRYVFVVSWLPDYQLRSQARHHLCKTGNTGTGVNWTQRTGNVNKWFDYWKWQVMHFWMSWIVVIHNIARYTGPLRGSLPRQIATREWLISIPTSTWNKRHRNISSNSRPVMSTVSNFTKVISAYNWNFVKYRSPHTIIPMETCDVMFITMNWRLSSATHFSMWLQ